MTSLYSDASVYDILHTPGTAAEVDGLLRIAALYSNKQQLTILEPACGSGRYLRVLANRGHRALGFDLDQGMVDYANARLDKGGLTALARVLKLKMEDFATDLPRGWQQFDFAFNPINTIRHLESDESMLAHLREVRSVLRKGGVYLVGLSLSAPPYEQPSEDIWEGTRGGCHVKQLVSYLPPESPRVRKEQVLSHLTITTPTGTRYADSTYWLRTYTLRQWRTLVKTSGMELTDTFDETGEQTKPAEPGYCLFALRPI